MEHTPLSEAAAAVSRGRRVCSGCGATSAPSSRRHRCGGPGADPRLRDTYRAPQPETAARVANALAAVYLQEDVRIRGRKASEAVQVLKEQVEEVSRKLQDQRQKLGAYPADDPADAPQQTAVDLAALGRLHADLRSTSDERLRALDRRNDILRRMAEAETGPSAPVAGPTRLARLRRSWSTCGGGSATSIRT